MKTIYRFYLQAECEKETYFTSLRKAIKFATNDATNIITNDRAAKESMITEVHPIVINNCFPYIVRYFANGKLYENGFIEPIEVN